MQDEAEDEDDDDDDDERFEAQLNSLLNKLERRSAEGRKPPLAGARLLKRLALLAGGADGPAPLGAAGAGQHSNRTDGGSATNKTASSSAAQAQGPTRYSTPNLLLSTNFEHLVRQRDKVSVYFNFIVYPREYISSPESAARARAREREREDSERKSCQQFININLINWLPNGNGN